MGKVFGFGEDKCKEPVIGKNTDFLIIECDFKKESLTLDANSSTKMSWEIPTDFDFDNIIHIGTKRKYSSAVDGEMGRFYPTDKCQGSVSIAVEFSSSANQIDISFNNDTSSSVSMSGVLKFVFMKYDS